MITSGLMLGRANRPKKPRIRWTGFCWHCVGAGRGDFGNTPANAYTMWRLAGIVRNAA